MGMGKTRGETVKEGRNKREGGRDGEVVRKERGQTGGRVSAGRGEKGKVGEISPPRSFLKVGAYDAIHHGVTATFRVVIPHVCYLPLVAMTTDNTGIIIYLIQGGL